MSAMKFNSFEKCKPKELVRFSDRTGTHWALVGDRGNARLMLLVLSSGKDGPHCINIMGPMDMVRHPYENASYCLTAPSIPRTSITLVIVKSAEKAS